MSSDTLTPDLILGLVLGVIFLGVFTCGLLVQSDNGDIQGASDFLIFTGHVLLVIGLPLALVFVIGHFIIKYW